MLDCTTVRLYSYIRTQRDDLYPKKKGPLASREIPHILRNPEGSLPHSQMPATCPYPKPGRSSPHPHILPPEDPS